MSTSPPPASESLHTLVARLRAERRLSVAQLATRTGLSPNAVRWIERGMTQPKPESLRALAAALDVPYEMLLQKAGYLEQKLSPPDEQRVLVLFRDLSPDRQALALQLLEALGTPAATTEPTQPGEPPAAAR